MYDTVGSTLLVLDILSMPAGSEQVALSNVRQRAHARRSRTIIDTVKLRSITPGDTTGLGSAFSDIREASAEGDSAAAERLARWLWDQPCVRASTVVTEPFGRSEPVAPVSRRVRDVSETDPFLVVAVDEMPPILEGNFGVVRRPKADTMDVVVIRRSALSAATIDTAITALRVLRRRPFDPRRIVSVSGLRGVPPVDSIMSRQVFVSLSSAPVRDIDHVGRGRAIAVPVLDSLPGFRVRRAP